LTDYRCLSINHFWSLTWVKEKHGKTSRRNFLKTVGAVGIGSVFASARAKAEPSSPEKSQESRFPQVPRRKLGKTGVEVPCLSIGLMYNLLENQIVLRKSLDWGVNY